MKSEPPNWSYITVLLLKKSILILDSLGSSSNPHSVHDSRTRQNWSHKRVLSSIFSISPFQVPTTLTCVLSFFILPTFMSYSFFWLFSFRGKAHAPPKHLHFSGLYLTTSVLITALSRSHRAMQDASLFYTLSPWGQLITSCQIKSLRLRRLSMRFKLFFFPQSQCSLSSCLLTLDTWTLWYCVFPHLRIWSVLCPGRAWSGSSSYFSQFHILQSLFFKLRLKPVHFPLGPWPRA